MKSIKQLAFPLPFLEDRFTLMIKLKEQKERNLNYVEITDLPFVNHLKTRSK